jgi:hypothetical protein
MESKYKLSDMISNNYLSLIIEAIKDLKETENGSTRQQIKKYIEEYHKIELVPSSFKNTLKYGYEKGILVKLTKPDRFKLNKIYL